MDLGTHYVYGRGATDTAGTGLLTPKVLTTITAGPFNCAKATTAFTADPKGADDKYCASF